MTPAAGADVALTGLVLAGGQSRRMGTDKAALRIDGTRMVDRAVAALDAICDEVLLAAGQRRDLTVPGTRSIPDAEADVGPLGGLIAGLEHASTQLVAVLAVDHVDASPRVLTALAEAWDGQAAVVAQVDGRVQPLHAIWASAAASDLRGILARGDRSLRQVLGSLDILVVGPEVWGHADPDGRFAHNANRPEDLR